MLSANRQSDATTPRALCTKSAEELTKRQTRAIIPIAGPHGKWIGSIAFPDPLESRSVEPLSEGIPKQLGLRESPASDSVVAAGRVDAKSLFEDLVSA